MYKCKQSNCCQFITKTKSISKWLQNRKYTSKYINKLIDDAIVNTQTKYVLNCQKQFYKKFYDNVNEINDSLEKKKNKYYNFERSIVSG